jgi:hypothetical protein
MRGRVLILCCAAILATFVGGGATAAEPGPGRADCTWGASSVVAELKDGELVVSEPATSGCIP